MGESGASKSFVGTTACTGYGISSHSVRFRVYNGIGNGFIFENSCEVCLGSIRANDGYSYLAGGINIVEDAYANSFNANSGFQSSSSLYLKAVNNNDVCIVGARMFVLPRYNR
jgi:hypothetical protein